MFLFTVQGVAHIIPHQKFTFALCCECVCVCGVWNWRVLIFLSRLHLFCMFVFKVSDRTAAVRSAGGGGASVAVGSLRNGRTPLRPRSNCRSERHQFRPVERRQPMWRRRGRDAWIGFHLIAFIGTLSRSLGRWIFTTSSRQDIQSHFPREI